MNDLWKIGVVFSATSNVSKVLGANASAAQRASSAYAQNAKNLSDEEKAAIQYAKAMEARRVATLNFVKTASIGLSVGLGAFILDGIKQAATFEMAITKIGIATRTQGEALNKFRHEILEVSSITAQDPTTIGSEYAMMAKSGLFNSSQLFGKKGIGKDIALYADVQNVMNGTDPAHAAKQGLTIAHYFGAYTQEAIRPLLKDINAITKVQGENMEAAVTQGKYFMRQWHNEGVDQDTIIALTGFMGQSGLLRGRGGVGAKNLLNTVNAMADPHGHLSKQQLKAENLLGLKGFEFFDKNGHFRFDDLTKHLLKEQDLMKKSPGEFADQVGKLFGQEAVPLLSQLLSQVGQEQYKRILHQVKTGTTVEQDQDRLMDNPQGRWKQTVTNFRLLLTSIFDPFVKGPLKDGLNQVQQTLGKLAIWFMDHPKAGMGVVIASFGLLVGSAGAAAMAIWKLNTALDVLAGEGLLSKLGGGKVPPGTGKLIPVATEGVEAAGKVGILARIGSFGMKLLNFATLGIAGKLPGIAQTIINTAVRTPLAKLADGLSTLALKALDAKGWISSLGRPLVGLVSGIEGLTGILANFGKLFAIGTLGDIITMLTMPGSNKTSDELQQGMYKWRRAHGNKDYDQSDPYLNHLVRANMRSQGIDPRNYGIDINNVFPKSKAQASINGERFADDFHKRLANSGPLPAILKVPLPKPSITYHAPTINVGGVTIHANTNDGTELGKQFSNSIGNLQTHAGRTGSIGSMPDAAWSALIGQ